MRAPLVYLLLVSLVTFSRPVLAESGYYWGTKGARAAGRAGAFVAKADDLMAVELNPAGLALIPGTRLQIGNRFSYHSRVFTRQPTLDFGNETSGVPPYVEFETVRNAQPWQFGDPLIGVTSDLGLEGFGFALAALAPAGVSRQSYPAAGGQRYMLVRQRAQLLSYTASAAWSTRGWLGVGASLSWLQLRRLDYQLVLDGNTLPRQAHPVAGELDMLSSISVSDPFTLNATLGAWYRPFRFLQFGVSAQVLPSSFEAVGSLQVEPVSPAISDNVELTRDGEPANDVTLSLPLPLTLRFGARYLGFAGILELFDLEFDVVLQTWSRVDRIALRGDGLTATLRGQPLNVDSIHLDKHWRDTVSFALGGDYRVVPGVLTLRSGIAYQTALAAPAHAGLDFPTGAQLGAGVGASVFLTEQLRAAIAYEVRYQPRLHVTEGAAEGYQQVPGSRCQAPYADPDSCHPEYLGRPAPPVNAGSYEARSHMLSLDMLYQF